DGNVDLADLDRKIGQHADRLAAIMVTYPSTHGVYETGIAELCAKVHDAGGQVYVDGANLNALLGFAKPGQFGADVSHLNLHKTFCIPHGGGGPGVGPVAVRAHLAEYLPGNPLHGAGHAVSAAPHGSAGILPIPWAYLRMMGPEGLAELDRFCDAMIAIRAEIGRVGDGDWPARDNPLVNAPHTAAMVTADGWEHAYPRSVAAYPSGVTESKYWAPVRRIDGAYG